MKLKVFLEEFFDSYSIFGAKTKKDTVEVFVNPTKKEIDEVSDKDAARFIANPKTKRIYIFTPDVIHYSVAKRVRSGTENPLKTLWGVAHKKNNQWTMLTSDTARAKKSIIEYLVKFDWGWSEKYIKGIEEYLKGFL